MSDSADLTARIDALVRDLTDTIGAGATAADSARVNALRADLKAALFQARLAVLPPLVGDLGRCDLCHALTPLELLRLLPCADFVLLTFASEDGGTTVCRCHAPPDLLAGDDDLLEDAFEGAWGSCPACQADVDPGRWHAISERSVAHQAGVFGDGFTPELMLEAHLQLLQFIRDHRLPGDWLPFVSTTG